MTANVNTSIFLLSYFSYVFFLIVKILLDAKGLSIEGQQTVAILRNKIQEMLFQIVKELHPNYSASSRFGNLLLLLPTLTVNIY